MPLIINQYVGFMTNFKTGLLTVIATLGAIFSLAQDYRLYPMWNPALPLEQRVNDLVSRLTLEEKVAQMMHATPAVPRLGITAYDWWNEVLHGVARTPFRTTVFPQAIGMAATWDTLSLRQMARMSAMEGRAINNKAVATGRTQERYWGLTYWTPNINIFRDPRWGRGQETYGEDPFLTGKLGAAFVRGLQGDHPQYLLAAACAKHFAVHSGPESSRHSDNFDVSDYELWDTYLPAFRELVVDAKVAGVMCAYNAFRTQPCCANDLLMNDILRKQWGFQGYVTSDCWALDDFFRFHKTHPNATASAIDALIHGTDVECGNSVYSKLLAAVKNGDIAESQLDVSLRRLFTIRFRLGMFDPPEKVPYASIPESMLEAPEHQAHALKMARQSIVLLKNANQTLPLKKDIKRIGVIGPNANNKMTLLGNYNGIPSHIITVLEGIQQKLGPKAEVIYEQGIDFATDTLYVPDRDLSMYTYGPSQGFQAEYFNNENLSGEPALKHQVPAIDFHWSEGQAPAAGVASMHFSARYTSTLRARKTETLTWQLEGDDGFRLLVNDSLVIDAWQRNRWGSRTWQLAVQQGREYKIVLEHRQSEGNAVIRLAPGSYRKTDLDALARRFANCDAIVFAGGISPQLEGEQMQVQVPGFEGGDRSSIRLPAIQTMLLQKLQATGRPVVFVMMTGSAIAIPDEQGSIPAILNAWYGGQSAGTAIADVLFGDYNPAGRLPVTFYASDADLPPFKEYGMQGRTYRYFTGQPLYPFGYGLSYSNFKYANLELPNSIRKSMPVTVGVTVTNYGEYDGEEVVQLYVHHALAGVRSPRLALKGFQRIMLKKGESRTLRFVLDPTDLSLVNERGELYQPAGKVTISVGGGQPGVDMPGAVVPQSRTMVISAD